MAKLPPPLTTTKYNNPSKNNNWSRSHFLILLNIVSGKFWTSQDITKSLGFYKSVRSHLISDIYIVMSTSQLPVFTSMRRKVQLPRGILQTCFRSLSLHEINCILWELLLHIYYEKTPDCSETPIQSWMRWTSL